MTQILHFRTADWSVACGISVYQGWLTEDESKVTCDSCRAVMASISRPAGAGTPPVDAKAGVETSARPANTEAVDHPPHYVGSGLGSLECIDAIDALVSQMKTESGFYAAQVLKYMWRHEKKGKPLEDLKKAQWYLNRLTKKLEGKP